MLTRRANRLTGFTLIEMVVTMSIFALLVALTVPTMRKWVANTKIRTTAEFLQNGIRLAQTEALRRSRVVLFTLTNTPNPQVGFFGATLVGSYSYWAAQTIPIDPSEAPVIVGSGPLTTDGLATPITGGPLIALCFNSVGRLVQQVSTGVAGAVCIPPIMTEYGTLMWPLTVPATPPADQSLTVEVTLAGKVRLCYTNQPYLSTGNPYGC